MNKKILILALVFISITIYFSSLVIKSSHKSVQEEIITVVTNNYIILEKNIENKNYDKNPMEVLVKDINYKLLPNNIHYVNYEYTQDGSLKSTSIYGFYYTSNDTPVNLLFHTDVALRSHKNGWITGEEGLDSYYTERIRANWFYYKLDYDL